MMGKPSGSAEGRGARQRAAGPRNGKLAKPWGKPLAGRSRCVDRAAHLVTPAVGGEGGGIPCPAAARCTPAARRRARRARQRERTTCLSRELLLQWRPPRLLPTVSPAGAGRHAGEHGEAGGRPEFMNTTAATAVPGAVNTSHADAHAAGGNYSAEVYAQPGGESYAWFALPRVQYWRAALPVLSPEEGEAPAHDERQDGHSQGSPTRADMAVQTLAAWSACAATPIVTTTTNEVTVDLDQLLLDIRCLRRSFLCTAYTDELRDTLGTMLAIRRTVAAPTITVEPAAETTSTKKYEQQLLFGNPQSTYTIQKQP